MGYRAPSADDVYRYVFRLDHESRSLADGFGFSIIFVNDDSAMCRDFLSRYFVDLCYRTADRIRIVFFSDLPDTDLEHIASQMNEFPELQKDGILGRVIESTTHKPLTEPRSKLLDHFLEALHFRSYGEADVLLSRISNVFGPRYADALYLLVREHRHGDTDEVERQAYKYILELKDRDGRSRRDPFQRIYDDRWRDLTPASLIPIDAPERTRELSFDARMNTAMPGVGQSMRFAARLGIGRHVPCFVFFSDVGELSVEVLPLRELSADVAYEKLKNLIDRFYEENRQTIEKWTQVEREITTIANSVNRPLVALRYWISSGDSLWRELRSIAQIIVKLSAALPKPEIYKSVIDGKHPSSAESSLILSECQKRFADLAAKKADHESRRQRFQIMIEKLNTASNFAQLWDAFYFVSREPLASSEFMDSTGVLRRAMNVMSAQRQILRASDPNAGLLTWWRHVRENLPSFRQFRRARHVWPFVTDRSDGAAQSEYASLLDGIYEFPCSDATETMVEKTRVLLANIVGIEPHLTAWNTAFAVYSDNLTSFFRVLHDSAPEWIHKAATELKISDVVPFRTRIPGDFKEVLGAIQEDALLRRIIPKVEVDWPKHQAEMVAENEKIALRCRDEVVEAIIRLREEPLDLLAEEATAYLDCLRSIRNLRDNIERKLADLANSSPDSQTSPYVVTTGDIEHFSSLLDEYDRTVSKLLYSYKSEPSIQNVGLPAPVSQILELRIPHRPKPSDRQRKELEAVARDSRAGLGLFQEVENRSSSMTPRARLLCELTKQGILPELADNRDQTFTPTVANLEELLSGVNDNGLRKLLNVLTQSTVETNSRRAIIEMILAITGTIPVKEQNFSLARKATNESQLPRWPAWMDEVLNPSDRKSHLDIGIVVALEEEFQELAPQIETRPYYNSDIKQYYYLFERDSTNGALSPYRCVVTFMGSMGPTDAALVSDRLMAQFDPALIVSIGIAGSMDRDVLVGSVVVGDQTDEYLASGKAIETKDKQDWDIQFSGNPYKSDPTYVSHAMNLKYANQEVTRNWQTLGKQKLLEWIGESSADELIRQHLIGEFPEIHTGHIASGPIVGAANQFVRWLKEKHDRKLLALEMESVGVLNAAHKRAVSSLIVRGISDYSDERKLQLDDIGRGALRRYAMNNALRLLWLLMDRQLINRSQ